LETYATQKGQIVIPSKLRRKYGIKAGTRIEVIDDGSHIVLQPITREYIHGLRSMFKGKGLLKAYMREKQRDKEHEK